MKNYAVFFLFSFALCHLFAQTQLSTAPNSPYIYAYRLSDDEANNMVANPDVVPDTTFLHSKVDSLRFTANNDSLKAFKETLRKGYYLFTWVEKGQWVLKLYHLTALQFDYLPGINQTLLYLNVPPGEAKVLYDNNPLSWSAEFQTFILPGSKHKGIITVQTTEEKAFYAISHRRHSKTISAYTWSAQSGSFRPYSRQTKPSAKGYIITNQPKYLPGDTVRLKAFILRKNGKPLREVINLRLKENRYWQESPLTTLSPSTPGAYIWQFPIPDSLPLDKKYQLTVRRTKNKKWISLSGGEFLYEDYQLKNVTYLLNNDSPVLTWNDSLVFTATATDANGQPAPDTRIQLAIRLRSVVSPPDVSMHLASLLADTTALIDAGKWKFALPPSAIPHVPAAYAVTATFTNSENETRDTTFYFTVKTPEEKKDEETIAGKPVLPTPDITLSGNRTADSVFIHLTNPAGITFSYQWWKGKTLVKAAITGTDLEIAINDDSDAPYRFQVDYLRDGKKQNNTVLLPVFTQALTIEIRQPGQATPGEKVPVTISVKDYQNQPVSGVNLTALTVSNQFETNHVPDPPYLGKPQEAGLHSTTFSVKDDLHTGRPALSSGWLHPMGLDTMVYFKLKYPDSLYLQYEPIPHYLPQFSPYVYKEGEQQLLLMIWLDDQPVYYSGVQVSSPYAFIGESGYHTLTLRTRDAEYTLPGIQLKKGYKLEISLNAENLPEGVYKLNRAGWLTEKEASALNRSLVSISPDYRPNQRVYLWQSRQGFVVNYGNSLLAGPFTQYEPLQFRAVFSGGEYREELPLRPGYNYQVGEKITLLEKSTLLSAGDLIPYTYLPYGRSQTFGQTALLPGDILSDQMPHSPARNTSQRPDFLKASGEYRLVCKHPDKIRFLHLQRYGDRKNVWTIPAENLRIPNLSPGIYEMTVENYQGEFAALWSFEIKEDYIFFDQRDTIIFEQHHYFARNITDPARISPDGWFLNEAVQFGADTLSGTVNNAETGAAIRDAKVILYAEGKQVMGSVTDADGRFIFPDIYARHYELMALRKGYSIQLQPAEWQKGKSVKLSIKPVLSGKIDSLKVELAIQKVPNNFYRQTNYYIDGVRVRGESDNDEGIQQPRIVVRGASSVSGSYRPADINLNDKMMLDEVVVTASGLKKDVFLPGRVQKEKEEALFWTNPLSGLYGSRAPEADSIFLLPYILRSEFADCAAWEPNLITGADGTATFTLTFPDNITTWNTYVLAMNDKRQSGYGKTSTQVSRPVIARLGMPRFALTGDSLSLTGRVVNYTGEPILTKTIFTADDKPLAAGTDTLLKNFLVEPASLVAGNGDSMKIAYQALLANGYSDGEQRYLPILPVGLEEHTGSFHYLEGDTALSLRPNPDLGPATLQIHANPLEVLLEDLEWLKRYPFECNEQLASKLIAWSQEKKIRQILNQPFDHEIAIQNIKRKLLRNRNKDGSWGWWENGSGNVWMTAYITRALLVAGEEKDNLAISAQWLLDRLFTLSPDEALYAMLTLSEMYPVLRFPYELEKAEKLASRPYHQLLITRIRQNQGLPVDMEKFWDDSHTDLMGGKYWGPESWYWYGGNVEMTTLAYEILRGKGQAPEELTAIRNYLLRVPNKNTIETARILSVVLPDLAAASVSLDTKATISLQNQELVKEFPVKRIYSGNEEMISIQKTGLQPVFVSLTQNHWNPQPPRRDSLFEIHTSFAGEEGYIPMLKTGEKAWLQVNLRVREAGEYLMLQIPVPAGCSFGEKKQAFPYADHAEYYKDRVNLWFSRLPAGSYTFRIELEPRYTGNYTLNPAQIEMMYAPVKNGNNEISKTEIR
ncbi:MAG: alpha-2-macroglobulin family protein [Bacteroidia bacterium]